MAIFDCHQYEVITPEGGASSQYLNFDRGEATTHTAYVHIQFLLRIAKQSLLDVNSAILMVILDHHEQCKQYRAATWVARGHKIISFIFLQALNQIEPNELLLFL
jgi:hypothetical protein